MRTSFIVPVYNEEQSVLEVLKRIHELPIDKEIIVVDDGSNDKTAEMLKAYQRDNDIIVHASRLNFGKGTAIRIGLTYASGDIVAIQDGDMEYRIEDYLRILEEFSKPDVQVVYGSRFMNGMNKQMKWRHSLANVLLRVLANILYSANITDEATAYKAFRSSVIKNIPLSCRKFEFCPEITAKVRMNNLVIHEVPVDYHPRSFADGKKIKAKDGVVAVWTLIRYRLNRKKSLIFDINMPSDGVLISNQAPHR